ncbi:MAG: hypothetical protein GY863_23480 [bacterium]|nr:hypothetical protein [bacterium]
MEELIIIAIVGGIVAVDTTAFGQFMLSQPLFSASVLGLVLGDAQCGVEIGIIMQFIWLKQVPAGGTMFLNGNLGTITAAAALLLAKDTFAHSHQALLFNAVIFGLAASYLFGFFTSLKRRSNIMLIKKAGDELDKGNIRGLERYHLVGVAATVISGMIATVLISIAGKFLLLNLPDGYYTGLEDFFTYGIYSLYGIGIGNILAMQWENKSKIYAAMGIAAGLIITLII